MNTNDKQRVVIRFQICIFDTLNTAIGKNTLGGGKL